MILFAVSQQTKALKDMSDQDTIRSAIYGNLPPLPAHLKGKVLDLSQGLHTCPTLIVPAILSMAAHFWDSQGVAAELKLGHTLNRFRMPFWSVCIAGIGVGKSTTRDFAIMVMGWLRMRIFTGGTPEGLMQVLLDEGKTPSSTGHVCILADELETFLSEQKILNSNSQANQAAMGCFGQYSKPGTFVSKTLVSSGTSVTEHSTVTAQIWAQPQVADARLGKATAFGKSAAGIGFSHRFVVFSAADYVGMHFTQRQNIDVDRESKKLAGCLCKALSLFPPANPDHSRAKKMVMFEDDASDIILKEFEATLQMRHERNDDRAALRSKTEHVIVSFATCLHLLELSISGARQEVTLPKVSAETASMAVEWYRLTIRSHPLLKPESTKRPRNDATAALSEHDFPSSSNSSSSQSSSVEIDYGHEEEVFNKLKLTLWNVLVRKGEPRITFAQLVKRHGALRLGQEKITGEWVHVHCQELCSKGSFRHDIQWHLTDRGFEKDGCEPLANRQRPTPIHVPTSLERLAPTSLERLAQSSFGVMERLEDQVSHVEDEVSQVQPRSKRPRPTPIDLPTTAERHEQSVFGVMGRLNDELCRLANGDFANW
jgi:hypothetical protein